MSAKGQGTLSRLGEFGLIGKLQKFQRVVPGLVKGIGDDAAVFKLDQRRYQLFTTDMLVEDVHFRPGTAPADVGYKSMAVNISDIAAMGGVPTFAVVSLGLPPRLGAAYVQGLYRGFKECADAFGATIVGGDTVRADRLVINVALLGEVERDALVLRSGARPGDRIFVTGPLGGSFRSGRHLRFTPRVKEARFLVKHFRPSAMIDLSDGMAGDLGHILQQSRVGACLYQDRVPCHVGVTFEAALREGEDFELLFTLSSLKAKKLLEYGFVDRTFSFIEIGKIIPGRNRLYVRDGRGGCRTVELKGYTHF